MREWCSCSAAIRAPYKRVIEWRTTHHCPDRPEQEPEKQGSHAQVELAYQPDGAYDGERFTPTINARIGFNRNP
jgi:hypothetical protein